MIYLWVAIGGALGSVARFWLGNVMAMAVGSAFPWGTLLINIIGSFVISFFGMLTGATHIISAAERGAAVRYSRPLRRVYDFLIL